MRTPKLALQILTLTGALALLGAEARAGDCHCDGAGYRTARGRTPLIRSGSSSCSYRVPHHPSTRRVVPCYNRGARGQGTPWSVLRRYLPSGRDEIRRMHVRNYFLRRYPFALAPGAAGDAATVDDRAHVDALLAIGDEHAEAPRKLDRAGHLDRGMGRFFTRDYDGARRDFEAALKSAAKANPRARWGLLLVAVCKNEWKTAAAELATLAEADELKRDDRLELSGSFADPSVLPRIVKGLREYAGYATGDADAHLVTAWALAYQGDTQKARVYLRMAQRRRAGHPAVKALAANLKPAPKKAEPKKTKPVEKVVPAPKSGLHKEIAQAR